MRRMAFVTVLSLSPLAAAAQAPALTVESIMRGPDLVGTAPFNVQFSADGRYVYFRWRQPRIGSEKFYGGVLTHDGRGQNRTYQEIKEVGQELKRLAPALKDTKVVADACILFSHENDWNLKFVKQPNKHFHLREHIQLFYNALHDRNIPVDFARPTEDLSKYKIVIAPSLQLLAGGDRKSTRLNSSHRPLSRMPSSA